MLLEQKKNGENCFGEEKENILACDAHVRFTQPLMKHKLFAYENGCTFLCLSFLSLSLALNVQKKALRFVRRYFSCVFPLRSRSLGGVISHLRRISTSEKLFSLPEEMREQKMTKNET